MAYEVSTDPYLLDIEADRAASIESGAVPDAQTYDAVVADLSDLHYTRRAAAADFASYALPQIPDKDRDEIYERIVEAERWLVAPQQKELDYAVGTATTADELYRVYGSHILLTAEHATDHYRPDTDGVMKRKQADYGTAGLSTVLQEDVGTSLIVPRGRQTGDANYSDGGHPIKRAIAEHIDMGVDTHLSIHSMGRSYADSLIADRSYQIALGVGGKIVSSNFTAADVVRGLSDSTQHAVEVLQRAAAEYDLKSGVNQPFVKLLFKNSKPVGIQRHSDGSLKPITLSAGNSRTTRSFVQASAEAAGKDVATIQVELADVLTLLPLDYRLHTGEASQKMGVYLGYRFLKDALQELRKHSTLSE
jgi:hypothetical protein